MEAPQAGDPWLAASDLRSDSFLGLPSRGCLAESPNQFSATPRHQIVDNGVPLPPSRLT